MRFLSQAANEGYVLLKSRFELRFLAISTLILGLFWFVHSPAVAQAKALDASPAPQVAKVFSLAESLEGNYLAALIAMSSRDTQAASVYYRESLKSDPRNVDLLERAFASSLAAGDLEEGFRVAQLLVVREPKNSIAHLTLGVQALGQKNYVKARQHLTKSGVGRSVDLTSTLLTAWSWLGSQKYERGVQTADRLVGDAAYTVFRDYHVGLMAHVVGKPKEAELRLKRAFEGERTTLRVVDAYARILAANSNSEGAKAIYEAFERSVPRQPLALDALQKIKDNKPLPLSVATANEGASEVLYGLGSAGVRQEDSVVTLIYLRLALHLNPNHTMALITLADLLERIKQPELALQAYRQVSKDTPLKSSVDIQIGLTLESLGKGDEAVAHLNSFIEQNPKDLEALTSLGNIYRSRKQFDRAVDAYTKAVLTIPTPDSNHWSLFYYRGISLERIKQWPKAEEDLKKSLSLIPDTLGREKALVLNYLGYSWVDQHLNIEEAFQMLRKAVELQPRDGYIVDSLGWAFYRLERYEEALKELEKAIELRPSDPVINDHLGDVYWKVGRKLEAYFQWQHAKDLNPEPDDLKNILLKLEKGLDNAGIVTPKEAEKTPLPPKSNGG
jgi:tetratricopeptide (TPR) repeat protein